MAVFIPVSPDLFETLQVWGPQAWAACVNVQSTTSSFSLAVLEVCFFGTCVTEHTFVLKVQRCGSSPTREGANRSIQRKANNPGRQNWPGSHRSTRGYIQTLDSSELSLEVCIYWCLMFNAQTTEKVTTNRNTRLNTNHEKSPSLYMSYTHHLYYLKRIETENEVERAKMFET